MKTFFLAIFPNTIYFWKRKIRLRSIKYSFPTDHKLSSLIWLRFTTAIKFSAKIKEGSWCQQPTIQGWSKDSKPILASLRKYGALPFLPLVSGATRWPYTFCRQLWMVYKKNYEQTLAFNDHLFNLFYCYLLKVRSYCDHWFGLNHINIFRHCPFGQITIGREFFRTKLLDGEFLYDRNFGWIFWTMIVINRLI